MNILYIASSADWHIDLWVKFFTKEHNVYLFSDKEEYLKDQPYENVTIIHSNGLLGGLLNTLKSSSHKLFQLNKLLSVGYFARKVEKVCQQHDIDIIHAHSLYYGWVSGKVKPGLSVVFTPMGSDVILQAQSSCIYRMMAKSAFARADVITGDSALLQNKGYKIGARKERNYVIQNGVDSNIFYPQQTELRKKYGLTDDELLLFSPRAITDLYNIDIIMDAIASIKAAGIKVKCMFSYAFGGEYLNGLKRQIELLDIADNVIWLGFLTYSEMALHYNAGDIIISVPSSDSSPKSVYEAMFCRKPIIVSDLSWSYELLADANCLHRVPVRDAEAISQGVQQMVADPEYLKLLADNAYNCAFRFYDYENNMKVMEDIMLATLKKG